MQKIHQSPHAVREAVRQHLLNELRAWRERGDDRAVLVARCGDVMPFRVLLLERGRSRQFRGQTDLLAMERARRAVTAS